MEDRLQSMEIELTRLRGEVARLRRRSGRRWQVVAAILAVVALLVSPLGVFAANFIDLNGGSPHNANINAIADAGISRGCNADGSRYCPNDLVTREQMASFLARTAGLGGNAPVTNAAWVDGYNANDLVRTNLGTAGSTVVLDPLYQSLAATNVIATGPGFVYFTGTTTLQRDPFGASNVVAIRPRYVSGNFAGFPSYSSTAVVNQTVTVTWVFQIAPGNNVFSLDGGIYSGSGIPGAFNSSVSVLFVPFGPGGFQGAEISEVDQPTEPPKLP